MERGKGQLVCENFYDEAGGTISIPLDPLLTPQQNAAKYYKRYAKAKSAEHHLQEQMEIARRDIAYMESVLEAIQHAETEQDFLDIRAELREGGFLKKQGKKEIRRAARPRQFRTSSGFRVLVGRNNRQNDQLTMKEATIGISGFIRRKSTALMLSCVQRAERWMLIRWWRRRKLRRIILRPGRAEMFPWIIRR